MEMKIKKGYRDIIIRRENGFYKVWDTFTSPRHFKSIGRMELIRMFEEML